MPMPAAVRDDDPWTKDLSEMRARLGDTTPLLQAMVDRVLLPALARNYLASGIKTHNGMLYRGITQRNARGNQIVATPTSLRVGLSYEQLPYARYVIEGRGAVVARKARALHFFIGGQEFFRRRVRAAPPHEVYYLTDADLRACQALADEYAAGLGLPGLTVVAR